VTLKGDYGLRDFVVDDAHGMPWSVTGQGKHGLQLM
jgi:hypothetical protein